MKEPSINCAFDELRDIVNLVPHPQNPNTHSDSQIELLAKIIQHQGWRNPVVVSERSGFIVAGHGRLMAAEKLKLKQVPVDLQAFDNEADELAHLVADNRIAELAETDRSVLADLIDRLDNGEYDLTLTGFEESSLEELMLAAPPAEGLTDEDEVPEPPENPTTVEGAIWLLGNHRLMCGDSTSVDAVEKLMDGEKADMVFTDPPYNIDYQGVKDKRDKIKNDKMSDEDFLGFLRQSLMVCETMYVCCSWQYAHLFKQAMTDLERAPKAMIVWNKVNPAQHLDKYFKQHEIIFYYGDFGGQKTLRGDVWELKRQRNTVHPTMKPVELIDMAMVDQPNKKIVYDAFGGSGSTLIACEKTNRQCRMMELDPKYCDVIIKRWQDFTGKEATHAVTGKTFNESH